MAAAAAAATNAANAAAAAAFAAAAAGRAEEAAPPRLSFRLPQGGQGGQGGQGFQGGGMGASTPSPLLSDLHSRISQLACQRQRQGQGLGQFTSDAHSRDSGGTGGTGANVGGRVGKADAAVGSGLQVGMRMK